MASGMDHFPDGFVSAEVIDGAVSAGAVASTFEARWQAVTLIASETTIAADLGRDFMISWGLFAIG